MLILLINYAYPKLLLVHSLGGGGVNLIPPDYSMTRVSEGSHNLSTMYIYLYGSHRKLDSSSSQKMSTGNISPSAAEGWIYMRLEKVNV